METKVIDCPTCGGSGKLKSSKLIRNPDDPDGPLIYVTVNEDCFTCRGGGKIEVRQEGPH